MTDAERSSLEALLEAAKRVAAADLPDDESEGE